MSTQTPQPDSYLVHSAFEKIGSTTLPDDKNRISLGKSFKNHIDLTHASIDGFDIYLNDEGEILLKPMARIPASELWIHQNPEVIAKLKRGALQGSKGQIAKTVKDKQELTSYLKSLKK